MGVPKTIDHIKFKIDMLNPSQEPLATTKPSNQDLKDMDVLCTFKIKIESQNSEHGCIKDQLPSFLYLEGLFSFLSKTDLSIIEFES